VDRARREAVDQLSKVQSELDDALESLAKVGGWFEGGSCLVHGWHYHNLNWSFSPCSSVRYCCPAPFLVSRRLGMPEQMLAAQAQARAYTLEARVLELTTVNEELSDTIRDLERRVGGQVRQRPLFCLKKLVVLFPLKCFLLHKAGRSVSYPVHGHPTQVTAQASAAAAAASDADARIAAVQAAAAKDQAAAESLRHRLATAEQELQKAAKGIEEACIMSSQVCG
jgi:hypothetical protein